MIHACQTTFAGPLLGPALRRIRSTPLARLSIGYRLLYPPVNQANCSCCATDKTKKAEAVLPVDKLAACDGHLPLGKALLLARILTGGNQNEGLPLANWHILARREGDCRGLFFDALA